MNCQGKCPTTQPRRVVSRKYYVCASDYGQLTPPSRQNQLNEQNQQLDDKDHAHKVLAAQPPSLRRVGGPPMKNKTFTKQITSSSGVRMYVAASHDELKGASTQSTVISTSH